MKHFRKYFLLCLLVLSVRLQAESKTVNGVTFSCEAIPQANINGVPSASLLRATLTNVTNKTMVMKYRFISTSTGGRTFTSPEEGKSLPIGDSYYVEHTVFNKVDFSDEFPKTCKFVEVQVCPAYPAK
jgi:hypothetical protein